MRPRVALGLFPLAVLVGLMVMVPALAAEDEIDVLRTGLYLAVLAATWSLLAGVAGQFSFGHVALAGLGAYAGAIWARQSGAGGGLGPGLVSIALGAAVATGVGLVLALLLDRLRGAYLALFTLAFGAIVHALVVGESDLTGGALTLAVAPLPGSARLHYYLLLLLLILVLAGIGALLRSRLGLLLRALREDVGAAAAMGVDVYALKIGVFTLTAFLVGLAASTYYHTTPRISPDSVDLLLMSQVVAFAVIGGLESPLAAALAAVALTWLLEHLRTIDLGPVEVDTGIWRLAIFGALLVLTLRFARNGLLAPVLQIFQARTGKTEP